MSTHDHGSWHASANFGRGVSRRGFMGGAGALGAATLLPAGLVVTGAARAASPRRGGRLRIGWNSASANDTLDPERLTSSLDWTRAFQIMSTLVRFRTDMGLEADLAESWEGSADATTWTFSLRKGVEFHNGKPLTAADVVYSLSLHRGEASQSPIKVWMDPISELKAVDPHTVRIVLAAPNADMPRLLGWPNTVIVPEGFTDFANAVGTGPFRVKSFKPGISLLAERNPNYHFEGRPYLDEVESVGIGDTQARTSALLAGDIHFIVRVDPKQVELLERAPGVVMASAEGGTHTTFAMMCDRPPTDNASLRKALRLLADREGMLKNVQKGYGALGNDTPFPPSDPYYCKDLPQRSYDPEEAKFHLRQAGMEGATLELHTSEAVGGSIGPDLALHFRQSAAKAGLTVNIIKQPADGYWSAVWMKHPFHMSNWFPRPTMDLILTQLYTSDAKWNEGQFKNERFDTVVAEARGTLDGAKRYELYCEAQRLLYEEGCSIIPLFTNWLDAHSANLKGWQGHPFGQGDGHRLAEHVWLES